jgi:hypothetical protein
MKGGEMKKRLAIGIIALLVLGVGVGAAMIAAYTKYIDMGANGTEFPEDEMRALLRKYNVTEDNITICGLNNCLNYTVDELLDLYRKYNITENDIKFAMGELPNPSDGTIFDGKHRVIETETGEPPEGMKEGVDYDIVISREEANAIIEEAVKRYKEKYGVDPGNPKIDVINGIPFPVEELKRLVESGILYPRY